MSIGTMLPDTVLGTDAGFVAVVAVALGALLAGVLRYESGVPLLVSAIFVPPIVALGFGLAWVVHVTYAVPIVHASALLGCALLVLVGCHGFVTSDFAPWATR